MEEPKLSRCKAMIKSALRLWLGIEDNSQDIEGLVELHREVREELGDLQEESVSRDQLQELESRLRDLEPIHVDLTNREWELLQIFFSSEEFLSVQDVAQELDTSRNNAGSVLSNLKKKVEFDVKTVENNKKLYSLPRDEQEKILGKKEA